MYDETNSICKEHLKWYTSCLKGSDSADANLDVYVSGPLYQTKIDEAHKVVGLLPVFGARPQCRSNLEPLVCLYYIHLCYDEKDTGPSKRQCSYVLKVCDEEVDKLKGYGISVSKYFMNCAPNSPFDSKNCIARNISSQTINCSEGFYWDKNRGCQPECNVWTPYSRIMLVITDILTVLPAIVGVISGIAVLLLSWVRRKKL